MSTTGANKVFIIAGPTAVGKTAVSIALAGRMGAAVISADSRQCYHELAIGTARPSPEQLALAKHYFIDEFPVAQVLSAADFEALSMRYLNDIFSTHHSAVVCGGTGLYIKALCDGLDEMPQADEETVKRTEAAYREHGMAWLQQAVQQEDPAFYAQGEIQNPARLLRALSFVRSAGKSILAYRSEARKERPFRIIKAALELPRERLYARINERVDQMMAQGLLAEVEGLLPYRHLKNLQTVGYAELFDYIDGKYALHVAVDKIKQHTRNYAKRQLTWFRKDKEFTWFSADDPDVVDKIQSLGAV